jgi:hypothetical protein
MNLPRRKFLRLAVGTIALPVFTHIVRAQAYPTRPVRVIVAYAPGGQTDVVADCSHKNCRTGSEGSFSSRMYQVRVATSVWGVRRRHRQMVILC